MKVQEGDFFKLLRGPKKESKGLVAAFFFDATKGLKDQGSPKDCNIMDGYLRQLAVEFRGTSFWAVSVTPTDVRTLPLHLVLVFICIRSVFVPA